MRPIRASTIAADAYWTVVQVAMTTALPVCLGAETHVGFKEGDQGDGDSAQEAEKVTPSGKVACETHRCAKNKGEQYPEENPREKSFTNGTVSSRWNGRIEVLERVIRYDGDR